MRDQYGREINYIRVSVTDRCNERCVYCMPENGIESVAHSAILTYDEITEILSVAAELGMVHVRLTGGEPLIRRNLAQLVTMLRAVPDIRDISLTTNGTLLASQMEALYHAGITSVNISLDTLDPDLYRRLTRGGHITDVLQGIEAACACPSLTVKVDCVLLGLPEQPLIDVASLAQKRPVHVRFIELMPIGMGLAWQSEDPAFKTRRFLPGEEARTILQTVYGEPTLLDSTSSPPALPKGNGPARYWQYPGFAGRIGFISAVSDRFCETCNRMRLTSQGFFKSCLQYESGRDLRAILRDQTLPGPAKKEALREAMKAAILAKPARHAFDGSFVEGIRPESHAMSGIGG